MWVKIVLSFYAKFQVNVVSIDEALLSFVLGRSCLTEFKG